MGVCVCVSKLGFGPQENGGFPAGFHYHQFRWKLIVPPREQKLYNLYKACSKLVVDCSFTLFVLLGCCVLPVLLGISTLNTLKTIVRAAWLHTRHFQSQLMSFTMLPLTEVPILSWRCTRRESWNRLRSLSRKAFATGNANPIICVPIRLPTPTCAALPACCRHQLAEMLLVVIF